MNDSSTDKQFSIRKAHLFFAESCNEEAWKYVKISELEKEEVESMIHAAHAALYHWSKIGSHQGLARANWLLGRVYAVAGYPKIALRYSQNCLSICETKHFEDRELAFAYEAMARAHAADGSLLVAQEWRTKADLAGKKILNEKDREAFFAEMNKEPWFGLI